MASWQPFHVPSMNVGHCTLAADWWSRMADGFSQNIILSTEQHGVSTQTDSAHQRHFYKLDYP